MSGTFGLGSQNPQPSSGHYPDSASLARKLQCDGRLPTCKRCARSQRPCQGYEMRLSWPRDNDRKRAIVGHDAPLPLRLHRLKGPAKRFFINTTWQDVEQYQHFALHAKRFHHSPCLYSRLREHPQHDANPMDLVRHCTLAILATRSFG